MIKLFIEPEQPAPEIAALRTELEKLRQQLTDSSQLVANQSATLFGEILQGQQKLADLISQDTSKTAESRLLIDSVAAMLAKLTEQMAQHLEQLQAGK